MKKSIVAISLIASLWLSACEGNQGTTKTVSTKTTEKPYQEIELEHLEGRFPQVDLDAMEDQLEEEVNEKGLKYRADDFAGYLAIAEEDEEQAKKEYPEYSSISYMHYFLAKLNKDKATKKVTKPKVQTKINTPVKTQKNKTATKTSTVKPKINTTPSTKTKVTTSTVPKSTPKKTTTTTTKKRP